MKLYFIVTVHNVISPMEYYEVEWYSKDQCCFLEFKIDNTIEFFQHSLSNSPSSAASSG